MVIIRSHSNQYKITNQTQIDTLNDLVAIEIQGWLKDGNNWIDEDGDVVATYGGFTPFTNIAQAMELLQMLAFMEDRKIFILFEGEAKTQIQFSTDAPVQAMEYVLSVEGLAAAITIACLKLRQIDIAQIIE